MRVSSARGSKSNTLAGLRGSNPGGLRKSSSGVRDAGLGVSRRSIAISTASDNSPGGFNPSSGVIGASLGISRRRVQVLTRDR